MTLGPPPWAGQPRFARDCITGGDSLAGISREQF
jgi:hypothetical protein